SAQQRLPPELLVEIFGLVSGTEHQFLGSRHHAPSVLSRVCSRWRAVCLSTPELWRRPALHLTDAKVGFVAFANRLLRRSAPLHLDLQVEASSRLSPFQLGAFASRLGKLRLHVTSPSFNLNLTGMP
ncbi:hypothetical protein C8R43DRAFT_833020, partial [Mycena crocata]